MIRICIFYITFAKDYHGVLSDSAEIIPIEPDAGNADAGI